MISVIVPIYNVEQYLSRCVDSLLAQTYRDFELILVDDGSPDNCGALCDDYATQDTRVRVIHKPNGGLSDARNAGLRIACGEYIAFVDSDDWVSPEYLEKLLNAVIETDADICECDIIRTATEYPQLPDIGPAAAAVYDPETAMEQLIRDSIFHQYVWNKLYKRHVIQDLLFPEGKTNEDEFWTYLAFGRANKVARINSPLYFYFQRSTSIMGMAYSLKRLDALEAKGLRQDYIEHNFSRLSTLAKVNLVQSAIYSGQMTLLHLSGEDKKKAQRYIDHVVSSYPLTSKDRSTINKKANVWLIAASISFWGTCRLKNLLKRGL